MVSNSRRIENERAHSASIAERAAVVWGHDSYAGKLRVQRRADLFARVGKMESGTRICELGCGIGIFTARLLECTDTDIVAVDLSDNLIEIARERVKNDRAKFLVGDCTQPETLGVALDFDVVVANSVLHHLELPQAIQAIYRMLKPGGIFVCSEPNMMNPQVAIQKNVAFIKRSVGDSPDETAFVRWRLVGLLKAAGFAGVQVRPFDFLHPRIPDVLAPFLNRTLRALEHIPMIRELSGSLFISCQKAERKSFENVAAVPHEPADSS